MKNFIYISLLTPFMAISTNIQPTISFGSSQDNLIKTYSAQARGNINGLKYEYYQVNNYIYNNGINAEIPTDLFVNITQIKFTLPSIENINLEIDFLSSITPWKDNSSIVEGFNGFNANYAEFLTIQDYSKEMFYINSMNLGNWQNTDLWNSIDGVWSWNDLAYLVYGDYGFSFLTIDYTKIFSELGDDYTSDIILTKDGSQPANLPNENMNYKTNIVATNTEYKEFYYTKLMIGTCTMQNPNATTQDGIKYRKTYNYVLNNITANMELLPPSTTPTTNEIVDIPQLMFTILTLPFAFISQAFDLTLFAGTPYAINISNLVICLIAVFLLIFVLNIIKKVLR